MKKISFCFILDPFRFILDSKYFSLKKYLSQVQYAIYFTVKESRMMARSASVMRWMGQISRKTCWHIK